MKRITYKSSGVDIKSAGVFKSGIGSLVRRSYRPEVLKDIGGFGSFFRFDKARFKDPVLVSSADGVGTKLKIACFMNKHDTVGIDAVGMNVNDILCAGAEPLFFLDYIAYSKLDQKVLVNVIKGLNAGCVEAGCSLIGGETAQMPGMYEEGEYDIAGFCVGVVERKNIIDGSKIKAGDVVIGIESNGLHSNGFSLVRNVFSSTELEKFSKELLKPTRIYVKPVLSLFDNWRTQGLAKSIRGISHITGGAFYDKIARILPDNIDVLINKHSWPVPKIFELIQDKGNIEDREMYHTLNMGIGMVLITPKQSAQPILEKLAKFKIKSWIIGEAIKGKKQVEIV